MLKLANIFTVIILLISLSIKGQQAGSWTSHMPYKHGLKVTEAGNKIFCVVENGLFYFDKEDNSSNKFTKDDGLTSTTITSINYHEETEQVILGYSDGEIDIINKDLSVTNLTDISRTTSVVGSKTISNISLYKNIAYLSTNFGVVVLNLETLEIIESYRNIGPNGEEGIVKNVIIDDINNQLYTHNEFGLCKAPLDQDLNLLNFENWEYITDSLGERQNTFEFYAFFEGQLHAGLSRSGIYAYTDTSEYFTKTPAHFIDWSDMYSLSVRNNKLVSTYLYNVFVYENGNSTVHNRDFPYRKNDALVDKDGFIWSAEENAGLTSNYLGEEQILSPNGVTSSSSFSVYANDDDVIVGAGGYSGTFKPNFSGVGFYHYSDFEWENYNSVTSPNYDYLDIVNATYDQRRNKFFLASYTRGLLVWDGKDEFIQLTPEDSASVPFYTISGQTRITSTTLDNDENLWVTNHLGNPSIHKLNIDNTWESFSLQDSRGTEPLDLLIDNDGKKWILAKNSAIIVWDDVTNEERALTNSSGNGALPSSKINCITKDLNGQIWVGTDAGVAVFSTPEDVLVESFYEASLPIFEQRPLLQDEQVLSIAVDGANRKWFGTTNGVFLFDENATENIETFNTSNSLLPSNTINDIAILGSTGEVFFATLEGIVSFWGDASTPEESFGDAKIFPNPIDPNFDGYVTINGLKESSIVKITDVSGKLVYEQISNGGTATWNTKTLEGKQAATGVYLVYSTDQEFEEQYIGKIVVVH